jgi:hypothetical protein
MGVARSCFGVDENPLEHEGGYKPGLMHILRLLSERGCARYSQAMARWP